MDTFKAADFALSVLFDAAAWTVFKMFRTVFHTDKMVLRQSAFFAGAAGGKNLFQQSVSPGALTVGVGKQKFADFAVESLPF